MIYIRFENRESTNCELSASGNREGSWNERQIRQKWLKITGTKTKDRRQSFRKYLARAIHPHKNIFFKVTYSSQLEKCLEVFHLRLFLLDKIPNFPVFELFLLTP